MHASFLTTLSSWFPEGNHVYYIHDAYMPYLHGFLEETMCTTYLTYIMHGNLMHQEKLHLLICSYNSNLLIHLLHYLVTANL